MMKNLFKYFKIYMWFRKELAKIYVFDLREEDIICLNMSEKLAIWLHDRVYSYYPNYVASAFSIGDKFSTNIKNMCIRYDIHKNKLNIEE